MERIPTAPRKAVVTAAGLGTRLLPMTKELPKEMLPICSTFGGRLILKPLLQALFEQFFSFGLRDFCFIVGRGKRAISDHFTPDYRFVGDQSNQKRGTATEDLENFYRMISTSNVFWVNQPEPKGFGHAILLSKSLVNNQPFYVAAGDTLILSKRNSFLKRMTNVFLSSKASVVLLVEEVQDPRPYGVISVSSSSKGISNVSAVIEKPKHPPTNLAIMPIYIFTPKIFNAIERTKVGSRGEIELTDAIQQLIDSGETVLAVQLLKGEVRLDIGTPVTYHESIQNSFKHSRKVLRQNK